MTAWDWTHDRQPALLLHVRAHYLVLFAFHQDFGVP